jgi:hypothetical protein
MSQKYKFKDQDKLYFVSFLVVYWSKKNASITQYQFWQHHNHPIELADQAMFEQKLNYIHQNPVVAGFVNKPEDWLYSSAKNYFTNELPVLDVIMF